MWSYFVCKVQGKPRPWPTQWPPSQFLLPQALWWPPNTSMNSQGYMENWKKKLHNKTTDTEFIFFKNCNDENKGWGYITEKLIHKLRTVWSQLDKHMYVTI